MIESIVCFETGYEAAHKLKINQYADLMEHIDGCIYSETLVTLEIGSGAFLTLPSFTQLKQHLPICNRQKAPGVPSEHY